MPIPNVDQVKHSLRWAITVFGAGLAGWFAAKGYFTVDQVTSILNNQDIIAAVATVIVWIWGMFVHTDAAKIDAAANVAEVDPKKLTQAGLELAKCSPNIELKTS